MKKFIQWLKYGDHPKLDQILVTATLAVAAVALVGGFGSLIGWIIALL